MKPNVITHEEFIYRQSEAFAQQKALDEQQWHEMYDNEERQLLSSINSLLGEQTTSAYEKLLELLRNPHLQNTYSDDEPIAYMLVLLNIYQYEKLYQVSHSVLEKGTSISELIAFFQNIKHLLWKIEFSDMQHSTTQHYGNTEEAELELFNYIECNHVSIIALRLFISFICVNPEKMLLYIANQYLDMGMLKNTYLLLEHYNENYPGNPDVEETLKMMTEQSI